MTHSKARPYCYRCQPLQRQLSGARAPMEMSFLRSPGESLRKRLEELNEKTIYCAALFALGPVVFARVAPGFPDYLTMGLLVVVVVLCLIPVMMVARQYRTCSLGLAGERVVGEQLIQLMAEGCRVFHDYPGGDNWNIDHVVVAPSGVYAVETKTRSKRRAPAGKKDQEVGFDGARLHFPHFSSTSEVEQARRNAADLGRELSSATGEPVQVKAILTFPG